MKMSGIMKRREIDQVKLAQRIDFNSREESKERSAQKKESEKIEYVIGLNPHDGATTRRILSALFHSPSLEERMKARDEEIKKEYEDMENWDAEIIERRKNGTLWGK